MAALLTGFASTVFDVTVSPYVVYQTPTPDFMPAARYSTIPVVLIGAAGIVAVDSYVSRHGGLRWHSIRPLVAVCLLACALGFGWATDFRYVSQRAHDGRWRPYARSLVTACTEDPAGDVTLNVWGGHHDTVPCTRIRR
ncbi:MAG: hypothetical protein ACRDNW_01655 [Trebonia sp.]